MLTSLIVRIGYKNVQNYEFELLLVSKKQNKEICFFDDIYVQSLKCSIHFTTLKEDRQKKLFHNEIRYSKSRFNQFE